MNLVNLEETKYKAKLLIQTDLKAAIDFLEEELDTSSEKSDKVLQIKVQFQELNRKEQLNLIDFEKVEISKNNIRDRLLQIIGELINGDLHSYILSLGQAIRESDPQKVIQAQKRRIGESNKVVMHLKWCLEQEALKNDDLVDENSGLREEIIKLNKKLEFYQNAEEVFIECYFCNGRGYIKKSEEQSLGNIKKYKCPKCNGSMRIRVLELNK